MSLTAIVREVEIALASGVLSILDPCVIPILCVFSAWVGATTLDVKRIRNRKNIVAQIFPGFVMWFMPGLFLYELLLAVPATSPGSWAWSVQSAVRIAGGCLVVLMGLYVTGFIPKLNYLEDILFHVGEDGRTGCPWFIPFLAGAGLAAGWSPCPGNAFTSMLLFAATAGNLASGVILMSVYLAGLCVMLLLAGLAFYQFFDIFHPEATVTRVLGTIFGLLLIVFGISNVINKLYIMIPDIGSIIPV